MNFLFWPHTENALAIDQQSATSRVWTAARKCIMVVVFLGFIRIISYTLVELLPCGGATGCAKQTNGESILKPISDCADGAGFSTSRDCFLCGFTCITVACGWR